jgi:hypothetical protein
MNCKYNFKRSWEFTFSYQILLFIITFKTFIGVYRAFLRISFKSLIYVSIGLNLCFTLMTYLPSFWLWYSGFKVYISIGVYPCFLNFVPSKI